MKTKPLGHIPPLDIDNDRFVPDPRLQVPAYRPPLPEATLVAALKRTETDVGHARLGQLNALAWFVKLAQVYIPNAGLNLPHASPGDILAKQEEFAALERQLQVRQSPPLPSTNDLCLLSIAIQNALLELRQTGATKLGPFFMFVRIELPPTPSSANPVDHAHHMSNFNRAIGAPSFQQDKAVGRNGLMREFAGLLKKYATSLRCCPHCEMLFVKPRKNADYCSRSCQNKHYMQTMRESLKTRSAATRPQKATATAKKGKQHHGKTHRKGRAPHGTKTHR